MFILAKSIYQNIQRLSQTSRDGLGFATPVFCSWLYSSRNFTITERTQPEKTTVYALCGKRGLPLLCLLENEGGKADVMNQLALHPHPSPSKKMKNSSLSWSTLNPQWILPISVLQCARKVSRKDPSGGHCLVSMGFFQRFT